MPRSSPVLTHVVRSSYGPHLLDHLAAYGTGLAGGQVAVVALLEVDADLPWCVFTTKTWLILKSIHITVLDVF